MRVGRGRDSCDATGAATNALICKAAGESRLLSYGLTSQAWILRPIRLPPESLPLLTRSRQFVGNSTPVIDSNHKIIKNQYPGETVTSSHSSFVLASFLLFSMTSTPNFERRTQMQAPKRRRNHPPALAGGATTSQFSLIHYRNPHNIADAGLLSLYVRGRDSCRQHDNIPGLRDLLGTYQFDGSIADILRCAEFYGF